MEAVYGWIKKGLIVAFAAPEAKRVVRRTDIDGMLKQHRVTDATPNPHERGRQAVLKWHEERQEAKAAAEQEVAS